MQDNNTGDSTPPCLTPFMTVKDFDITLSHFTPNAWFVYINNIILKTKGDISITAKKFTIIDSIKSFTRVQQKH